MPESKDNHIAQDHGGEDGDPPAAVLTCARGCSRSLANFMCQLPLPANRIGAPDGARLCH